ncbi:integrin alpha-X-like [Hemiscyllium ocellatum]|uniref:integrin alpha-X-like n=1 Tax=Hemiscyllium ocellatum TaxID=170820 RepID=UPI0029673B40|nr:integrin alpha-X-like [Hemiscyllium ocellatum]
MRLKKYQTSLMQQPAAATRISRELMVQRLLDWARREATLVIRSKRSLKNEVMMLMALEEMPVGPDFQGVDGRKELELIASNSSTHTVFSIQNFDALKTIQEQLQAKIFAIEGSHGAENLTVFQNEMAQEGFSSLLTSDAVVMGTPGAYGWTGGVAFYHRDTQRVSYLTLSEQNVAYTGYSVQKATRGGLAYFLVGAPRYRHTGKVVIFKQGSNDTWEEIQHIVGEQIGSSFGSELGAMDVDGDGDTDLLLIGAPLHQHQRFGGKVHVCTMSPQGNFSCGVSLRGAEGDGLGRFGSSVAVLRDLNGDGMGDVAVGAPLEDEHRGRVYIFHGEREGIKPQYSQCLHGVSQSQSLRYFGQSVAGAMDVSGDQLTDLAIGSLGTVTVFRSRPVVTVSPRAAFRPQPIPISRYRCHHAVQTDSPITILTICFYMGTLRPGMLGEISANLTYRLVLDFGRQHGRVTFPSFSRDLTTSRQLSTTMSMCEHHTLHLTSDHHALCYQTK